MAKIAVASEDVKVLVMIYIDRSTEVAGGSVLHQTVDQFGDHWVWAEIVDIMAHLGLREEFPGAKMNYPT